MTKQQSVEQMHLAGMGTKEIAERLGITRHDVSRCISDYRRKNGSNVGQSGFVVAERVDDYAQYNHRKAVRGARQALEAFGA
jgi:uncharacterized protein YjcR